MPLGVEPTDGVRKMITFMTFQTGEILLGTKREKAQHELRVQVQAYINQYVGAEQVISIYETGEGFNLYVTVWYRTREGPIPTYQER